MTGQEIAELMQKTTAHTLNVIGDDLAGRSTAETPVESGELRGSARYPSNDPPSAAEPEHLEAMVSFNTPYAAAQHEGIALQHRTKPHPHEVLWVVKNHPGGGKSHYLSDPFKEMVPRYEAAIAAAIKKALEEHHG